MEKTYALGINKAGEVVDMLLRHRHEFDVRVLNLDPLRYITVFTEAAVRDVEALLQVI
jgi:hypothetical protein